MSLVSHTLCKNSQPFIGIVLANALRHVDRAFVTISEKSTDGTMEVVNELWKSHKNQLVIRYENVKEPGELTQERQLQLDLSYEDWVWFLDDDDYWPDAALQEVFSHFNDDVDALSVAPYQVVDETHHDGSWRKKYFTKFFRNQVGVHYEHPWPRDLIYKGDQLLYWKKNSRAPTLPTKFFHLSNVKKYSFRNEAWATEYKEAVGQLEPYPEAAQKDVWRIFKLLKEGK